MSKKQFIKVDSDFFVSLADEKDLIKWYANHIKSAVVTILYDNEKYVLYLNDTPEWESETLDGIYNYITDYLNRNNTELHDFKVFTKLNDAFQYVCYGITEDNKKMLSKKVSAYEYLLEIATKAERYGAKIV